MNNTEKSSILVTLFAMIPLISLLFGDKVILSIPFVNKYKDLIFISLSLIIVSVFTFSFIHRFLQNIFNHYSLSNMFFYIIFYIIIIATLWDVVTSFYGFYTMFALNKTDIKIRTVAAFFAIVATFICFFITINLPPAILEKFEDFNKEPFFAKLLWYLLFIMAFFYDFCTSFVGNAALLGVLPAALSKMNIIKIIILIISTLIVSCCQFLFLQILKVFKSAED